MKISVDPDQMMEQADLVLQCFYKILENKIVPSVLIWINMVKHRHVSVSDHSLIAVTEHLLTEMSLG